MRKSSICISPAQNSVSTPGHTSIAHFFSFHKPETSERNTVNVHHDYESEPVVFTYSLKDLNEFHKSLIKSGSIH